MKVFSLEKAGNKIKITFCGIKLSFLLNLGLYNNKIFICDTKGKLRSVKKVKGIKFKFHGSNAKCVLPDNKAFKNCLFELWDSANIEIKSPQSYWINNLYLEAGEGSKIIIGSDCKFVDTKIYNWGPCRTVTIGNDCMFSNNTLIRTHDGHSLYDIITQEVINKAKDVNMGNHVWLAKNSIILKGVTVRDNTVIAANSVVTKSFENSNIVLAGNPARVVRENTNWDFKSWNDYSKEEMSERV